jgi:hypothetical protein
MKITESQLAKFQELYRRRFGEPIGRDEALAEATKLLAFVCLTHKPIKQRIQPVMER